jgi:ubiquitin conjugation factor E4 B
LSVEVEKTGASSQFYDKFGIRYNTAQVFKLLWTKHPALYREKVKQASIQNWDMFLKFVNLLMNDTTYLLDESVTQLMEIHSIQQEITDQQHWEQLTAVSIIS